MRHLQRWAPKWLGALLIAFVCAASSPAFALCTHAGNTTGTTLDAVLQTLTDICNNGSGGGGGGGATFGPDAVGASATHPPVIVGGVGLGAGHVVGLKVEDDGRLHVTVDDSSGNPLDYTQASSVYTPDSRAIDQTINSATSNAAYTVTLDKGEAEVGFSIQGLTASGATLTVESSNNIAGGTPFWSGTNAVAGSTQSTTLTTDNNYFVSTGGRTAVRLRVSATGTGTITISHNASTASSLIRAANRFPTMAYDTGGTDATNTTLHASNIAQPLYPTTDLTGATISFSGSGDNTLVSATSSQTTKVYRLFVVSACAQNLTFKSASTTLTGAMPVPANGSIVLDFSTRPWFTTGTNEAFILNASASCQVSGRLEHVKS